MRGEWALAVRQVAALRGHGLTSTDALRVVGEGLPAGEVKSGVERAREALLQGHSGGTAGNTATRALGKGDALPPAVLAEVATLLEQRDDVVAATRRALRPILAVTATALLGASAYGLVVSGIVDALEVSGFGALTLVAAVWPVFPVALCALVVWSRLSARPGRAFAVPAELRVRAAEAALGSRRDLFDGVELDAREQWLGHRLLERHTPPEAARLLADALAASVQRDELARRRLQALVVGVVAAVLAGAAVLAMFAPVAGVARSLQ